MHTTYIKERKDFLSRANKCLKGGLFDEANALAEERLLRYPGDLDAHIITATGLIRMGKLTQAWEVLSKLDVMIREWSQAYELLEYIYRKKGLPQEAIKSYKKFLCLNPESPMERHISNKIDSLEYSFEEEEAAKKRLVAAKKEIETVPKEGRVELEIKDTAENEEDGEGATRSFAADFDTITLADLYSQQGYYEMAHDVLNRILTKDPQNMEARKKLERMGSLNDSKWTPVIDELNRWLENLRRSELR